ncbi:hypothetical protein RUESEDTHA_02810 [Ruegeria sp. THAF57]|nr:hypothetical protein RUESEDTHA_02810 [Ruegeria sp. THAF57]
MISLRTFRKEEDGTVLGFAALCQTLFIGFAARNVARQLSNSPSLFPCSYR